MDDQWALIGRGEYFDDEDGARIISGTPATYKGLTGTVEYRPWENVITRFEARWDEADEDVFDDDTAGEKTDNQTTLGAELIYLLDKSKEM